MRHRKTDTKEVLDWQIEKYERMRGDHRPGNIVRVNDTTLEYDWVDGDHPTDWVEVVAAAEEAFWTPGFSPVKLTDRLDYLNYIADILYELRLTCVNPGMLTPILTDRLTSANMTHGDMSFANVIKTPAGKIVFIDPGNDRGLCCREIDESKMLQSLDGFDAAYRGWSPPRVLPHFPARRVHVSLLITHYARMQRHVNPIGVKFARRRIEELGGLL